MMNDPDHRQQASHTLSRVTKMLVDLGCLRHLGPIGRYALGNAVLTLGYPLMVSLSPWREARSVMRELAEVESGQVSLGVRDRFSVVSRESIPGPHRSMVMPDLGPVWPLLHSAMGRAHLAALAPADRDALLADFRRRGFISSFGLARPDIYAGAVPLRLRWNEEIMALNCSIAASPSLGPEAFTALIGRKLLLTARAIEAAVELAVQPDGLITERELSRIPLSIRPLRPNP